MTRIFPALTIALFFAMPAWADTHHAGQSYAAHASLSSSLSEGQIKKVDLAQGKLTIRHGPLENLGMPAMTMVFRVRDPAMLDDVKPGDNIRFRAEQIDGALTVTRLKTTQ